MDNIITCAGSLKLKMLKTVVSPCELWTTCPFAMLGGRKSTLAAVTTPAPATLMKYSGLYWSAGVPPKMPKMAPNVVIELGMVSP